VVATMFVDKHSAALLAPAPDPDHWALAVVSLWLLCRQRQQMAATAAAGADPHSPWHRVDGWRLNDVGHQTLRLRGGGELVAVDAAVAGTGWRLRIGERDLLGSAELRADGRLEVEVDGERCEVSVAAFGDQLHLFTPRGRFRVQRVDPLAITAAVEEAGDVVLSPMPGRIIRQLIAAGTRVRRGAPLLVLEAMKMEHTIVAPTDGCVVALHYAEGEQVEEGMVLLDFEAADRAPAA
jgi:3-methylcrotonyl-CoA carboxylase alpha subunit